MPISGTVVVNVGCATNQRIRTLPADETSPTEGVEHASAECPETDAEGLQPVVKARDAALFLLVIMPATVAIDCLILPAYFSTGNDVYFFPITRAVARVIFKK